MKIQQSCVCLWQLFPRALLLHIQWMWPKIERSLRKTNKELSKSFLGHRVHVWKIKHPRPDVDKVINSREQKNKLFNSRETKNHPFFWYIVRACFSVVIPRDQSSSLPPVAFSLSSCPDTSFQTSGLASYVPLSPWLVVFPATLWLAVFPASPSHTLPFLRTSFEVPGTRSWTKMPLTNRQSPQGPSLE